VVKFEGSRCNSLFTRKEAASPELPKMATKDARPPSIFRRPLPCPPALAAFESEEGQKIFASAMGAGFIKNFFGLAGQFRTQDEPSFCALGTLVMALNAMQIDSGKIWKGSWRWFHESSLDCCVSLEQVAKTGITMPDFKCLAECNGAKCIDGEMTLDDFRDTIKTVAQKPTSEQVLIVSYSRKHFKQTGDGHFSPIGGYDPVRDAILVMDVARFKLPAHWVRVKDMFDAMQYEDSETKQPRGYVVLEPNRLNCSTLFMFRMQPGQWRMLEETFQRIETMKCKMIDDKKCCKEDSPCFDADENLAAVKCFFTCMPEEISEALTTFEEHDFSFKSLPYRPVDHQQRMKQLEEDVEGLLAYSLTKQAMKSLKKKSQNLLLSTVLLLAFPNPDAKFEGGKACFDKIQDISGCSSVTKEEVVTLRSQILRMMQANQEKKEGAKKCTKKGCECR